jgi:hypothetical protein
MRQEESQPKQDDPKQRIHDASWRLDLSTKAVISMKDSTAFDLITYGKKQVVIYTLNKLEKKTCLPYIRW